MGVIVCNSPTGQFSVTVIPKCGSTTMRYLLAGCAVPGQYRIPKRKNIKVEKGEGWHLANIYEGQCRDRSWAVLRNPWRRLLTRWQSKVARKTWSEFVDAVRLALVTKSALSTAARTQTAFLGDPHPRRLVAIEKIEDWLPVLAKQEGVQLGLAVQARRLAPYDWKLPYCEHPKTRDVVREIFAADWGLGIDWEDPLQ